MARTSRTIATEGTVVTNTDTPELAAAAEAANLLATVQADYSDERDLLNQLLGQAQMAESFAKFSLTVSTSKLAFVKENKLYRALQGKRTADGQQFSGTWDDFCSLLGRSRQQVDEDIANLRCLGEEALESMSRMGIGYRELRQYRRLPEDQQAALIEVAKTGDKESFVELAEEIISKHAAEKAELNKKLEDSQADYDALSKMEADTSKKLRDAKLELERNQLRTLPWDERIAPLKEEITARQCLIDESLARHLQAVDALDAWLTNELTSRPDYDPESPVDLPPEALTVLVHLEDAIQRTAHLVAGAMNDLQNRFGADLAQARQHLLQVGE
ncbi:hypothetical protein [Pseudomonas aeruginosa]|uniref:hypothetical protein n=1 Tax=Pseudomonas aeruginosa TaxID=287 RepID=UPI00093D019D|nr:hypothetical protein [Pseudomonas aeruginosa]